MPLQMNRHKREINEARGNVRGVHCPMFGWQPCEVASDVTMISSER